jgi:hypothetical protein
VLRTAVVADERTDWSVLFGLGLCGPSLEDPHSPLTDAHEVSPARRRRRLGRRARFGGAMTMPIDRQAEVMRLFHAERWQIGTIAAQLGLHHSAVRRGLQRNGVRLPRPRQPTKMAAYVAMIAETLEKRPTLRSTRLLEMVRRRGYTGQISGLRQVVATLRPRGATEAYLRLTTLPGEQGQVDWADFGEVEVGRTRYPACVRRSHGTPRPTIQK